MMEYILGGYNYWMAIILMLTGLYAVIVSGNFVKKLIGLAIFQTSVLLLYISAGVVKGAHFPILEEGATHYINPLPHVLMLTAIVVGVATLAVGLALSVRIKEEFGTIEEEELILIENVDVRKIHTELVDAKQQRPKVPAQRMTKTGGVKKKAIKAKKTKTKKGGKR